MRELLMLPFNLLLTPRSHQAKAALPGATFLSTAHSTMYTHDMYSIIIYMIPYIHRMRVAKLLLEPAVQMHSIISITYISSLLTLQPHQLQIRMVMSPQVMILANKARLTPRALTPLNDSESPVENF